MRFYAQVTTILTIRKQATQNYRVSIYICRFKPCTQNCHNITPRLGITNALTEVEAFLKKAPIFIFAFTVPDLPFEEELLRNPHSLKSWLRYIESREDAPPRTINLLYERALRELPGSYKLWYKYLTVKREQVILELIQRSMTQFK